MLKIRLKRVGRKHDPSYRVVLIDSQRGPKSGKINEILGFYDPRKDIKELKADEIRNWISKGAQVSDTVHNILVGEKVIEGKKINVLPRKSPQGDSHINADDSSTRSTNSGSPRGETSSEQVKTHLPAEASAQAGINADSKVEEKVSEEAREETKSEDTIVLEAPTEEPKKEAEKPVEAESPVEKPIVKAIRLW